VNVYLFLTFIFGYCNAKITINIRQLRL